MPSETSIPRGTGRPGVYLLAMLALCVPFLTADAEEGPSRWPEDGVRVTFEEIRGLGPGEGIRRRDPSDVIRAAGRYFVWYTRYRTQRAYNDGTIWYATSPDGEKWTERGQALGVGPEESWDGESVFTPNILRANGRYFLFYTAISEPWTERFSTAIGAAVSDSPHGPWTRLPNNPLLTPGSGAWKGESGQRAEPGAAWDSHVVDDACLFVRGGRYWLYYKGREKGLSPRETKLGVAIAERPTGPYRKSSHNPLIGSGHEALVAPYREGVIAVVTRRGPERNTVQYAADGLDFKVKAPLRNPPWAPGAHRPDAFADDGYGDGFRWGISMRKRGDARYLVRFECDLSAER